MAEWLRRLALKLLAPLCWGSNPLKGSGQLLTEDCWFTPKEQFVPPAVETDRHIYPNMVEKWRKTPIHLTSPPR